MTELEPIIPPLECRSCRSPMVWNDEGEPVCTNPNCTDPKPRL